MRDNLDWWFTWQSTGNAEKQATYKQVVPQHLTYFSERVCRAVLRYLRVQTFQAGLFFELVLIMKQRLLGSDLTICCRPCDSYIRCCQGRLILQLSQQDGGNGETLETTLTGGLLGKVQEIRSRYNVEPTNQYSHGA